MYYLYILKNPQGRLYIGISKSPIQRLTLHNTGKGSKFTSDYQDFSLVYTESYPTLKEVMQRERQLKKWSRAKKEALIAGNINLLKQLAKDRKGGNDNS